MTRHRLATVPVIFLLVIGHATSALAQPSPSTETHVTPEETIARSPFPSAAEVSAIVGVEMETDGIYEGLGHDWRGIVLDGDGAANAWTQRYFTPKATLPEGQILVVVDIIRFESVEDAIRRVDEFVTADAQSSFDTGLSADWEATSTHTEIDEPTAASIFVREGPVAMAASTYRWDKTSPAPTTAAIAGFALNRLAGLDEWVIALAPEADAPPPPAVAPGARDRFPTAEEVGEVLGLDVGIRGIERGLSQLWEGMESDWLELPSAMLGLYRAPPHETDEPIAGVTIDIAEFATVDDAVRHADERFVDWPEGFETDLSADHVFSHTFDPDEAEGSFIVLRDGLVVIVVAAFRWDGVAVEGSTEAIAGLVLGRLYADN